MPAAGAPNNGVADARGAFAAGLLAGLTTPPKSVLGLGSAESYGDEDLILLLLSALPLSKPLDAPLLRPLLLSLRLGLLLLLRPRPALLSPELLASGPPDRPLWLSWR